jgi:dTDP-4-amino-4,6-dideoxygalactose transaminase
MKDNDNLIPWWNVSLGDNEAASVVKSINNRNIAQGKVTLEFENELAKWLGVPYVVCTTSGTSALTMACLASGIGPGCEVIIPNHTAPGTAHSAMLLGAKVVPIDLKPNQVIMDEDLIEEAITERTKAIIPVHMNGHSCRMNKIIEIADKHKITVIEDACQAIQSSYKGKRLGTVGRFGCYSLGLAKVLVTGQGGVICCNNEKDYNKLLSIRDQGIDKDDPKHTPKTLGFNFKFNDILASIGLVQLKKMNTKIKRQVEIHDIYKKNLSELRSIKFIPLDINSGEVPLRAQCLSSERERFIQRMLDHNIVVQGHVCNINEMPHIGGDSTYNNSLKLSKNILILPSGPDQTIDNVIRVVNVIKKIDSEFDRLI